MTSLQESVRVLEVDNPLNLRNLSKTRWTACAESIKSAWNSYEKLGTDVASDFHRHQIVKEDHQAESITIQLHLHP